MQDERRDGAIVALFRLRVRPYRTGDVISACADVNLSAVADSTAVITAVGVGIGTIIVKANPPGFQEFAYVSVKQ
jgi:hypothetical protein